MDNTKQNKSKLNKKLKDKEIDCVKSAYLTTFKCNDDEINNIINSINEPELILVIVHNQVIEERQNKMNGYKNNEVIKEIFNRLDKIDKFIDEQREINKQTKEFINEQREINKKQQEFNEMMLKLVSGIKDDVDTLKADMKEVKQDVNNLKTDMKEVKEDVNNLKTDMKEVKQDVQTLKTEMKEVKKDIKDIKSTPTMQKELNNLNKK